MESTASSNFRIAEAYKISDICNRSSNWALLSYSEPGQVPISDKMLHELVLKPQHFPSPTFPIHSTFSPVPPSASESFVLFRIVVDVYVITALCLVGLVGNTLSVAVLCHDHERSNTTTWLLQTLAVVDSLYLITCLFIQPMKTISEHTDWMPGLRRVFPLFEGHVWGVASTAQTLTVWIVLLVTADRFAAVCLPWRTTWRSVRRAKMAVALTVMAAVLYNLPRYFEREVQVERNLCTNETRVRTQKTSLRNDKVYFLVYKTLCYLVFRSVGPLAALIYFNLRLVRALGEARQRRTDLVSSSCTARRHTDNITRMLVIVVFIFVVCELPDLALRIAFTVQEFTTPTSTPTTRLTLTTPASPTTTPHLLPPPSPLLDIWTLRYINVITNALLTLNSSVNFLIYCLFGKKFRQIFLRVYGCREDGGAAITGAGALTSSVAGTVAGGRWPRMLRGERGAVVCEPTENDPICWDNDRRISCESSANIMLVNTRVITTEILKTGDDVTEL